MTVGRARLAGPIAVLVVDDNVALADNLTEVLEHAGYRVSTAPGTQAALAAARGGVDVALVDLQLPDGNGTSLSVQLRELNPDCEVVLLTGNATVESAVAAVRSGAWAYLIKPIATEDLLLTVQQAARQVRLKAEKQDLARRAHVAEKLAAVGTMTAGLSHEIRNPLNAAGLQLSVAERRIRRLPEDQGRPLLEPLLLVRDEIQRLEHIVEDFLQFARPVQFVPELVDLQHLFASVKALLNADAEARGVVLECRCDGPAPVLGDEGRLRQVLMNLALNALDATPRGGTVRVVCEAGEHQVAVVVEDSGSGIAPSVLPRIFEPFFTTKAQGSGLGLAISHSIVTQHGGTISAANVPGQGARFSVVLPRNG